MFWGFGFWVFAGIWGFLFFRGFGGVWVLLLALAGVFVEFGDFWVFLGVFWGIWGFWFFVVEFLFFRGNLGVLFFRVGFFAG